MNAVTTSKVERLRLNYTDEEVCRKIGITKPTLYSRLSTHKWKVSEIFLIDNLK